MCHDSLFRDALFLPNLHFMVPLSGVASFLQQYILCNFACVFLVRVTSGGLAKKAGGVSPL